MDNCETNKWQEIAELTEQLSNCSKTILSSQNPNDLKVAKEQASLIAIKLNKIFQTMNNNNSVLLTDDESPQSTSSTSTNNSSFESDSS